MEQAEPSTKPEHVDGRNWQNFPAGLKVLVVDDDPLCLKIIEQMLKRCNYEVFVCATAAKALEQLRDKTHNFDLVLSDVYMPDMDGFKLLEAIGLELDLPVIMMSCNGEHSTVMRGVTHGACDFLIKPVRIEELRNIWQHVLRRSKHQQHKDTESEDAGADMDAESSRKRKELSRDGSLNAAHEASRGDDDGGASKKPRVVWSVEMHQQFVAAVNKLGIDKAVPKKILEIMGVDGLTRENVASHLQKYRLYLKRVQTVDGSQPSNHFGGLQPPAVPKPSGKPIQQQQQLDLQQPPLQQQSSLDMQQQVNHAGLGQQQPPPQQQHMPGVMPGMPPGNGSLGMMSPFGPGGMSGMGMNAMSAMAGMNLMASMMAGLSQMGLPGMPGMPPMPGMGPLGPQAAAAAGSMGQMPALPGMGMPGMGGMPGMPGMPPMPGMPAMGHMPGMPGMPGQLQGSGINMQNDPGGLMSMMANMQALFQAQQQQAAAAAPTNSGGASSGGPAQAAAASAMPNADPAAAAAAAAAAAFMTGMNPAAMMASPAAVRPLAAGINGSGGGSSTSAPASAAAGTRRSAAGQAAAVKADQTDFSSVFDDVFDPALSTAMPVSAPPQQQQLGVAASRPIAAGDAAVGGMDDFFDYFLKG